MKLVEECVDDSLVVSTEGGEFLVAIDIPTGDIVELTYTHANIHTINSFLSKAKTRYNRFLYSDKINDFIR